MNDSFDQLLAVERSLQAMALRRGMVLISTAGFRERGLFNPHSGKITFCSDNRESLITELDSYPIVNPFEGQDERGLKEIEHKVLKRERKEPGESGSLT